MLFIWAIQFTAYIGYGVPSGPKQFGESTMASPKTYWSFLFPIPAPPQYSRDDAISMTSKIVVNTKKHIWNRKWAWINNTMIKNGKFANAIQVNVGIHRITRLPLDKMSVSLRQNILSNSVQYLWNGWLLNPTATSDELSESIKIVHIINFVSK